MKRSNFAFRISTLVQPLESRVAPSFRVCSNSILSLSLFLSLNRRFIHPEASNTPFGTPLIDRNSRMHLPMDELIKVSVEPIVNSIGG